MKTIEGLTVQNLIKKYKQEIKELELEIEIKPFKNIKHKIAQKATLDYVLKDLIELSELIADVSGMLPADRGDAEDFLLKKGISNHPHIQDSVTGKNDFEIADLMAEFANKYYGNYR